MDFVESVLVAHGRRDVAQATIKSKLRGRKLLMESIATVAPDQATRRPRRANPHTANKSTRLAGPSTSRASRRRELLRAVREVSYEQVLQQHNLWTDYASDVLLSAKSETELSRLVEQIDWHGAQVRVVRSKCPSHLQATGIAVAETRRMLLLLNDSRRAWIPKNGTLIEFILPSEVQMRLQTEAVQCEAERHEL
eukprot:CAMPEP_0115848708 /NCGR_PEP_ID=MMETSP0287-20121206/11066_1 /TAXON_ID=412157 /ORGANISM="Chrysochromulina rotalis, Strain UIO044" /LENGTH=194 /DNA_ID=CAMNT_0003302639 /DNA_START=14 /DNA_END=598 /DNA_ORIENTATION=+